MIVSAEMTVGHSTNVAQVSMCCVKFWKKKLFFKMGSQESRTAKAKQ